MGFTRKLPFETSPPARSPISADDGAPQHRQNSAMFCHFGRILATNPRVSHRRRVVPTNSDAPSMRLVAFGPLGIPKRQKSTGKLHTATRLHHGVTPWRTCCASSPHESPPRRPPASPTTPAPPTRRVPASASASRAPTAPDLPRAVTRRAARFPAATTPSIQSDRHHR